MPVSDTLISHVNPVGHGALTVPPVDRHESKAIGGAARHAAVCTLKAMEAKRNGGVTRMAAPDHVAATFCRKTAKGIGDDSVCYRRCGDA